MEKALPPLPGMAGNRKPRPPLPLSQRAPVATGQRHIHDRDEQLQRLRRENEHLRRLLIGLEGERGDSSRRIAELEAENHQYRAQAASQKQLVVRIANTISDAFHEYGEEAQRPLVSDLSSHRSPSRMVKEVDIGYEDVLFSFAPTRQLS
ncbi:hypothetical protein GGR57DRAFT_268663 [Xylariaceae sp. FL1272]|nr:hypothetical protein GGR57DRAFT_268663 [Xylariaceae sp. FL1272]